MATETVVILGDTYPVRSALRALGGTWDARSRCWRVPADKAAEAQALVGPVATPCRATASEARAARARGELCPECGDDCGGGFTCGYR